MRGTYIFDEETLHGVQFPLKPVRLLLCVFGRESVSTDFWTVSCEFLVYTNLM